METLKTDRSKACMSVPTQVGARTTDSGADPERDLSALLAAARTKAIEVMGQLGKLGDETFPARILEYVACAPRCTASSRSTRRRAQEEAQDQGRAEEGGDQRPASRVREVLEAASAGRPSRSCAATRTRSLWRPSRRNLEQLRMLGAYAPPGSAPFDLVMEFLVGPPPLGPDTAAAAEPLLGVDSRNRKKGSRALVFSPSRFLDNAYSIRRSCSKR